MAEELRSACHAGDLTAVSSLLAKASLEAVNQQGPDGRTCLHYACSDSLEEISDTALLQRLLFSSQIASFITLAHLTPLKFELYIYILTELYGIHCII